MSIVENEQPIRSLEISKLWGAINERTFIGCKTALIFKREDKAENQKLIQRFSHPD